MWSRINQTNKLEMEACKKLVSDTAEHYADYLTDEKIMDNLTKKRAEYYYYKDLELEIMLSFTYNATNDNWRIKNGHFSGDNPVKAMELSISKIKEVMEDKGKHSCYIIIPKMDMFYKSKRPYFEHLRQHEITTITSSLEKEVWSLEWQ